MYLYLHLLINCPLDPGTHRLPAAPRQSAGRAGRSQGTALESGVCFSGEDLGRRTRVLHAAEARVSKYYENKWVIHH